MDKIIDKFIALIDEPHFYQAVIWILTAAGVTLAPDQVSAIMSAGAALSGIVHAFKAHENTKPDIDVTPPKS